MKKIVAIALVLMLIIPACASLAEAPEPTLDPVQQALKDALGEDEYNRIVAEAEAGVNAEAEAEAADPAADLPFNEYLSLEPWTSNGEAMLTYNSDGTGFWSSGDLRYDGTWAIEGDNVVFTYELYGTRTIELTMVEVEGEKRLAYLDQAYWLPASRYAKLKEESDAAFNGYSLSLGETIALPFVNLAFNNLQVMDYVGKENIHYNPTDGCRFVALAGTLENTGGAEYNPNNLRGEICIDGRYTYLLSVGIIKGDTLGGSVGPLTTADCYLYANVPIELANSFTSCRVRFAFNDNFASAPIVLSKGQYVFELNSDEESVAAAQAEPEREKVYYEECPVLLKPESFMGCYQSGSNSSSSNGKKTKIAYSYRPNGSSLSVQDMIDKYAEGLRSMGFGVQEDGDIRKVYNGDVKIAEFTADGEGMALNIVPGNENMTEAPTPGTEAVVPDAPGVEALHVNDTISKPDFATITVMEAGIKDEVKFSEKSGGITYSSGLDSEAGSDYIYLLVNILNTSKAEYEPEFVGTYTVDGYEYKLDVRTINIGGDFTHKIAPLMERKALLFAKLPDSLVSSHQSADLVFGFSDGFKNAWNAKPEECDYRYHVDMMNPIGEAPAAEPAAEQPADEKEAPAASQPADYDPDQEFTDKETVKKTQQALNDAGYSCGTPDGIAGKNTAAAITSYQKDHGLKQTGTVTAELLMSLGLGKIVEKAAKLNKYQAVLQDIRVSHNSIGSPTVYVSVKNIGTKNDIVAFTFATQCKNAYGEILQAHNFGDTIEYWIWQEGAIKPGKATSVNENWFWTLYGFDTAYHIDVWLTDFRTSDGVNHTIDPSDYNVLTWDAM